jgi:UDP-glucose 4-epimerase
VGLQTRARQIAIIFNFFERLMRAAACVTDFLFGEAGKGKKMDALRADRVLITGGAGLVGSHIADLLVREGNPEIIVLDNFVRGRRENLAWATANGRVKIVEGDIRDAKVLREAMRGVDVVFHQAAIRITQCAEEPRLALEVLADGTFNVLEAAVAAKVKKVVAASSASVYGLAEEFPTTERHHLYNNRTLYGAAKVFNEQLLRSFHEMYGLNYIALRYFNVYGPRMDIYGVYTEVLIRWMERIAAGKAPLILGDGTQTMDFVYIEDIARANILAAKSDASDEVFNVASGVETSLNELANSLLKVMWSDLKPEYGPARKVNAVPRRLADTAKAQQMIGFQSRVTLEDGLRRLVAWWRWANQPSEETARAWSLAESPL